MTTLSAVVLSFLAGLPGAAALGQTPEQASQDAEKQLIEAQKESGKALQRMVSDSAPPALRADGSFDDSGVRITFAPDRLWRDGSGRFTGSWQNGKIALIYDFFDAPGGYSSCPEPGQGLPGADCGALQAAVAQALDLWADASGRLVFARRSSAEQKVNVWFAWTTAGRGNSVSGQGPTGLTVDNSRDADAERPWAENEQARGLENPTYPDGHREFVTILFNDALCWYVDDPSLCRPSQAPAQAKLSDHDLSIRLVSLHEIGHMLGFEHFSVRSIMGVAGGSGRYELTPYDREAVRRLYDAVSASLGPSAGAAPEPVSRP